MVTCTLRMKAGSWRSSARNGPEPHNFMYVFVGSHSRSVLIALVDVIHSISVGTSHVQYHNLAFPPTKVPLGATTMTFRVFCAQVTSYR